MKWITDKYPKLLKMRNNSNESTLSVAAANEHLDILRVLVQHGIKDVQAGKSLNYLCNVAKVIFIAYIYFFAHHVSF